MIVWADASAAQGRAAFGAVFASSTELWHHSDVVTVDTSKTELVELAGVVEAIRWAHQIMTRASAVLSVRCDNMRTIWLLSRLIGPRADGVGQCTHPAMPIPFGVGTRVRLDPNLRPDSRPRWKLAAKGSRPGVLVDAGTLSIVQRLADGAAGRWLLLDHAPRETAEIRLCDALARRTLGLTASWSRRLWKGDETIDDLVQLVVDRRARAADTIAEADGGPRAAG